MGQVKRALLVGAAILIFLLILVQFSTRKTSQPLLSQPSNTITAASCSQSDVQNAINSSPDGYTVIVPAGTCTWTAHVVVNLETVPKSLTIKGAGEGNTIIIDSDTVEPIGATIFQITTAAGKSFRLTGFTFESGNVKTFTDYHGQIAFGGYSKSVRIDHNYFLTLTPPDAYTIQQSGWVYGVIDHNFFNYSDGAISAQEDAWGNQSSGDGSWNSPETLGTANALYVENNTFVGTAGGDGAVDGYDGARVVFRYNKVIDSTIGNHGTDSSGRGRSSVSFEVYDNIFNITDGQSQSTFYRTRGGTALIFNNKLYGPWDSLGALQTYRASDTFSPFGTCTGLSPYDNNTNIVYASGNYTGASDTNGTLITNANWVKNQWLNYSVVDISKNWSSQVMNSTQNTITIHSSIYSQPRDWSTGDRFEILKVNVCLDQPGRGPGTLISGTNALPAVWPNEQLQPIYFWNNTLNGKPENNYSDIAVYPGYTLKAGRDYYVNVMRPGYTPYVYPYPLDTMNNTGSSTITVSTTATTTILTTTTGSSTSKATTSTTSTGTTISTSVQSTTVGSTTTSPTTSTILTNSTTTIGAGGGGGGGAGGGGGSGGSSKPIVTETSNGFVTSQIAQKNSFDITACNQNMNIIDNFITPTYSGISINNVEYTVEANTSSQIQNTNCYITLLNTSYLPIEQTITLEVYNSTPTAAVLTNQLYKIVGTNSTSINVSKANATFTLSSLPTIEPFVYSNLYVSAVSNSSYVNPQGYNSIEVINASVYGSADANVEMTYSYAKYSNGIVPFRLANNTNHTWSKVPYSINNTSGKVYIFNQTGAGLLGLFVPSNYTNKSSSNSVVTSSTTLISTTMQTTTTITAQEQHVVNYFAVIVIGILIGTVLTLSYFIYKYYLGDKARRPPKDFIYPKDDAGLNSAPKEGEEEPPISP
jgi:hypothetical protein